MPVLILYIPVGTATVEESFEGRLCNRLSDDSLPRLMRISTECSKLESMNFEEISPVTYTSPLTLA